MATPIEEFLIGLGFSVAQNQLHQFNSAISGANQAFAKLALAAEEMAAAVEIAFFKISDDLDKLYFQSQRTKASAENLVAFGYAARQTGVSANSAASSIENLASKLRRMPGIQAMLQGAGITETDPVKIIEQLQKRLSDKPMYVQLKYADMLGIDENLYLTLDKEKAFKAEQAKTAASMGINLDIAAKAANQLWTQLRSVGMVWDTLIAGVIEQVAGPMSQSINHIKQLVTDNAAAITRGIVAIIKFSTDAVEFLIKMSTVAVHFFQASKDWFLALPEQSQRVIEAFGAIYLAVKLLNGGLLATALLNPFNLMLAGLAAVLLLFDDYEHYKKNGRKNSLFDWGGMDGFIHNLETGLTMVADTVKAAWQWFIDLWDEGNPNSATNSLQRNLELARRKLGLVDPNTRDPEGSLPGSNNSASRANADEIRKGLIDGVDGKGSNLTEYQMAGMLNNFSYESGLNPKAHVIDKDLKLHVGIAQWSPERAANFKRIMGIDVLQSSPYQQGQFAAWELNNTHKAAGDKIRNTWTPEDASMAVTKYFEVPADADKVAKDRLHDLDIFLPKEFKNPNNPQSYPTYRGPTHAGPNGPIDESHIEEPLPVPGTHGISYHYSQGATANITQSNTYHITATDPHGTAREIEHLQTHNAQLLIRNTRRTMV